MTIRTKIICTIGPAVNSLNQILALIEAGMNVARINFSHGSQELHKEVIERLKLARKQKNVPLAIMLDTKGPEIRLGKLDPPSLQLNSGTTWRLIKKEVVGNAKQASVYPQDILDKMKVGQRILFDDGYLSSYVVSTDEEGITIHIENGGIIQSGKGINIPNVDLELPAVTEKDISDIRFGVAMDIDIIAASFVRSADHVLTIKKLLTEEKASNILVVAKIENHQGIENFESIVQAADGIMIARGDLGVEVPLCEVPKLQKMMIRKSYLAGKPVVTATQMLESMILNVRPTRAEVSDVANAIYDSTSAVTLSGETAIGKHPIETVHVMQNVIKEAEKDFNYQVFFDQHAPLVYQDVPSSVTFACVKTAYSSHAQAIFTFTNSGATAQLLSRLRPPIPIVAMTPNEKSYHQMAFFWGVTPFLANADTLLEAFDKISTFALNQGIVSNGDLVVISSGSPFGISGTTNMMLVESIGDVLIRGEKGWGERVYGTICIAKTPESKEPYLVRGHLLVLSKCDASCLSLIREAQGVILQNEAQDLESETFLMGIAKSLNKPILIKAEGALRILKEGQLVTLVPDKALIYKGVVL